MMAVMRPTPADKFAAGVAEIVVVAGTPRFWMLNTLKPSKRKWNSRVSPILKPLKTEKSMLNTLELRNTLREKFPYCPEGMLKALGSNHNVAVCCAGIGFAPGTMLGRE